MQSFIKAITLALLQDWALRQSLLWENFLLNLGVALCYQKQNASKKMVQSTNVRNSLKTL